MLLGTGSFALSGTLTLLIMVDGCLVFWGNRANYSICSLQLLTNPLLLDTDF